MKRLPILSTILFIGLLAAAGTTYAQAPPDVVPSDAAQNTAMGSDVMPIIDTGLRDGFYGAQRNTGVGYSALNSDSTGNQNTAVGTYALYWNGSGSSNSATGYMALACNTTGSSNTANGNFALSSFFSLGGIVSCTAGFATGNGNTASGAYALGATTSGSYNTASGVQALESNTEGSKNIATGYLALYSNTTGSYNTATGYEALYYNIDGIRNSASGDWGLYSNTHGSDNTASGQAALYSNTSGSNNIGLGANSGYYVTSGSNNIEIGNKGTSNDSGTLRIGTAGTQTATFIAGIENTKVTGAAVYITASGQLGVLASSERYKTAIAPMGAGTEKLSELRPVSFHLKSDPKGSMQYGLIAEQVARVYPELVIRDESGKIQGVRYDELAPMLLNEVQKQQAKIATLERQLVGIQAALVDLQAKHQLVAQR
jgi:hypothetical protein